MSDTKRLFNPSEWTALQSLIRSRYSMAEEQLMFDTLLTGAILGEVLDLARGSSHQSEIDDIELF